MNRKFILTTGMAGLVIIVAGCSGLTQEGTSPVPGDGGQSKAIETSTEELDTVSESGEVSITKVDTDEIKTTATGVKPERSRELESVTEAAPQTDETVMPIIEIPQPSNELAEGEYRWSQLLGRDSIFPIYNPEFASADVTPYEDNELVIGLEINGEAKAYAIGPLNGREMVNDTVGGIPVLVTW